MNPKDATAGEEVEKEKEKEEGLSTTDTRKRGSSKHLLDEEAAEVRFRCLLGMLMLEWGRFVVQVVVLFAVRRG